MKIGGIVLIAVGVLALIYGGFSYNRNREVLDIGGLTVTASEEKRVPVPAVVGVILLLAGAGLVVAGSRRLRIGA